MSRDDDAAPLARCLLVWVVATAAAAAGAALLLPDPGRARETTSFDALLVRGCELGLLGCLVWAWVVAGVVARDAASGRTTLRRGVPAWFGRALLLGCGLVLTGGVVAPVQADRVDRDPQAVLAGLPLPDRATATGQLARILLREAGRQRRPTTVVCAGDSLWSIAAATLPHAAGDVEIEERWRAIYAANRGVIGDDPDLILPGQRLRTPRR